MGAVVTDTLLRDEPLTVNKFSGALIALLGVILIIGPSALVELSIIDLAQLAVWGATVLYTFGGVRARLTLGGQSPLVNALGMLTGSNILMIPPVIFVDSIPEFNLS